MKLAAGVYTASLLIMRKADIHGEGATVIAGPSAPTLNVQNAGKVRVYEISLVNNNTSDGEVGMGIFCGADDANNTPELYLERSAVETVKTVGAFNACKLKVSRSTLKSPRESSGSYKFIGGAPGTASFDRSTFIGGGSIVSYGGHYTISNSVLDELLGAPMDGVLATTSGGSISVSFSTIFNSPMACGGNDVPACASAARTGVCVDNSIIHKPSSMADAVSGTNCRITYSIVSPQQGPVPGDNNMIGVTPSFKDPANKDFHLNADSPAINAANPAAVATPDYDGVMRPQGGRSDIGAFEFKE